MLTYHRATYHRAATLSASLVLIIGVFATGLLGALPASAGASEAATSVPRPEAKPQAAERAHELLSALVEEWQAPAVSTAVAVDGRLVFAAAEGRADAAGTPVVPETRFRIASVSKGITGVLFLRLAEEGLVDLDAPLRHHLPDLPAALAGATTRHLLAHTSGIRHYRRGESSHRDEHYRSPLTALEDVGVLAEPLEFAPGTDHGYTTYGYTLLQAVAERVTGLDFEVALDRFVFAPAGMERTWLDRRGREAERATGFNRGGPVDPDDVSFKYAGGGMASTPSDLVRLCAAIDRGDLLSAAGRRELLRPQFPSLDANQGPGFAVEPELETGLLRYWHPGRGNGFEAYLVCYPEERVAAAVATNQDWTDPWEQVGRAAETLARLYLPAIHLYRTPPRVLVMRLEELSAAGDLEAAVTAYRAYREEVDGMWGAGLEVHRLAERMAAEGNLAAADALFSENAVAYPESWHTLVPLARSKMRLGDLEAAAEAVERARPLVPDPGVLADLAAQVEELGRPPAVNPAGRYRLALRETDLTEELMVTLELRPGDDGLDGDANSPTAGELSFLGASAGGERIWVGLGSSFGFVELDLRRTPEGIRGSWRLGPEGGPLTGHGPVAGGGEEAESAAPEARR